jgi:acyl-CoA reductase-like NAD-dependent aldehyde dehydrogenase
MAARRQSTNELDAEDRNALSDKSFAFPRLRKEPLNDASHVRNAIARFDQVQDATDAERDEAFRRIKRAAKRHGVDMTETRWQELGKPAGAKKSSAKPRADRSRDELYAEAKRRNIKGRSAMTKADLVRALHGK